MVEKNEKQSSISELRVQTEKEREYVMRMEDYFVRSLGTNMDKLRNFTKFVPRQALSTFLAKHAIFQKVIGIHGYIIECGVFLGGG